MVATKAASLAGLRFHLWTKISIFSATEQEERFQKLDEIVGEAQIEQRPIQNFSKGRKLYYTEFWKLESQHMPTQCRSQRIRVPGFDSDPAPII
jgi:hypothetical protein